ncbi:aspartate kinase, partial [mine drainage metagenome]
SVARGRVPVVTGFFGRSLEGRVATLGRGGSDYAAAAIGAILGASRVELVKRHVAVFSADPHDVPAARPIPALSYEEAEELAQFGARVLHPLTIEPARAQGVELRVRSLEDASVVTTIGPARSGRRNRALTLLRPLRLLRLRVPGGRQRPGVVAQVSHRLAAARVNLVQLYTSSALLCL